MRLRSLALAISIVVFAPPAAAQFRTPGAAIQALYASYGWGSQPDKNGFDDKLAAQVFDKDLLNLYRRAVASDGLDDDFFVQGNNFSLVKPIEIGKASITGAKARVSATLTQNLIGAVPVHHFIFVLVQSDAGWQLDDATCDGKSVRDEWNAAIKGSN